MLDDNIDDLEFVDEHMATTEVELSRLRKHPELFPSKDIEKEFWQDVYTLSNKLEKGLRNLASHTEEHEAFYTTAAQTGKDEILPTRDHQRKPWEQFLHNRAPGSGLDLSEMSSEGSIQVLPMAAVRIALAMNLETKEIIRGIEAVSLYVIFVIPCKEFGN